MGGVQPEQFHCVVQRFFEAAAAPELWPEALHDLALACGASGACALPVAGTAPLGVIASKDIAGFLQDGQRVGWFAPERNTRMARSLALVRRGWRGIITERDVFSPEDLARDAFQQDFIEPHGFSSYAGAIVAEAPGLALPISIERRIVDGPFQRGEVALMTELFAHLRAAGEIAVRIGMASAKQMADALSATGCPVALLGRNGCVIHMNARFEDLIDDGIHIKASRLGSWQSDADRALATAIDRALRHDGTLREPLAPVVLPRRDGLRPLVAQVVPVVGLANDVLHSVGAIVTLSDLEAATSGPAEIVLEQAFGLTPAEARLAAQIAAGKTLAEVSLKESTARETLRSRLKAVFEKTGTSRQAELALLLAKVPIRRNEQ
jgi:DNA-binding CsgD family transcriptional regulator/PAS domain-containing protein